MTRICRYIVCVSYSCQFKMQLLIVLVIVTLSHANIRYTREPGGQYGGGGGRPGGRPDGARRYGNVVANAKGELGNVAANAISTVGGNVLANSINGTRGSSIAITRFGGDAQANSKGYGSGGHRSNAIAEGSGTAKGVAISLGTGVAQTNAISKGSSSHASTFSAGGGGSTSNSVSNDRGDALSDSTALRGKGAASNGEKIEWQTTFMPATCDRKSKEGDVLTTDYVGYFPGGKKFDSTYDRGQPMSYTMGAGDVIKGAEESSMGMCVGEKRHSVIPPSLAYGDVEYGGIPPGSTLVFDTVLTKIENGTKLKSAEDFLMDMGMGMNADGSMGVFH